MVDFRMVDFYRIPKNKIDHIGTMRKSTMLGPGASEPGPRAGPGLGLCLRAGSQYGRFSHGPKIVVFYIFRNEKIDYAKID